MQIENETEDFKGLNEDLIKVKSKIKPIYNKIKLYVFALGTLNFIIAGFLGYYLYSFIMFLLFVPDLTDIIQYIKK